MQIFHSIKKYLFSFVKTLPINILKFLHLQIFITLFSLPILLFWGLPLSIASPLGNFIFTPFITIFLLLSTIIFFFELLFIPNKIFIYLLEQLTTIWISIISWSDRSWLLYLPTPNIIFALTLPIISCLILFNKKITKIWLSTIILAITFILFLFLVLSFSNKNFKKNINYCEKNIEIIRDANKTALIDPGVLGRQITACKWVEFTLIPHLIKSGINHLDYIVVSKAGNMVFQSLKTIVQKFPVNNIFIPLWSKPLNHAGWRAWEELHATAKKFNTQIHLLDSNITLDLSNKVKLELTLSDQIIVALNKNGLSTEL